MAAGKILSPYLRSADAGAAGDFERTTPPLHSSKLFGRSDLYTAEAYLVAASRGDFVARIWTHYGAPDNVDYEGFVYWFCEKATGLKFSAYAGGSGPAYGGQGAAELAPVVARFEALLAGTEPATCEIEYETDFGIYRSGAVGGVPYDRKHEPKVRPHAPIDGRRNLTGMLAAGEEGRIAAVEELVNAKDFAAAQKAALALRAEERSLAPATKARLRAVLDKIDMGKALKKS